MLDLSHLADELTRIFEQYPAGNHCERCAAAAANVLAGSGYEVAIITLKNEEIPGLPGIRPPFIEAKKPSGERFLLAQTGFHIACRLREDQPFFFVDALSYLHYGLRAVDREAYFNLFVYPDGIEVTDIQGVS
jgi:hypothetical protein